MIVSGEGRRLPVGALPLFSVTHQYVSTVRQTCLSCRQGIAAAQRQAVPQRTCGKIQAGQLCGVRVSGKEGPQLVIGFQQLRLQHPQFHHRSIEGQALVSAAEQQLVAVDGVLRIIVHYSEVEHRQDIRSGERAAGVPLTVAGNGPHDVAPDMEGAPLQRFTVKRFHVTPLPAGGAGPPWPQTDCWDQSAAAATGAPTPPPFSVRSLMPPCRGCWRHWKGWSAVWSR